MKYYQEFITNNIAIKTYVAINNEIQYHAEYALKADEDSENTEKIDIYCELCNDFIFQEDFDESLEDQRLISATVLDHMLNNHLKEIAEYVQERV